MKFPKWLPILIGIGSFIILMSTVYFVVKGNPLEKGARQGDNAGRTSISRWSRTASCFPRRQTVFRFRRTAFISTCATILRSERAARDAAWEPATRIWPANRTAW